MSLLHDAVEAGDRAKVEALLAQGVNVNAPFGSGYTPLHRAAAEGNIDIAKLLLAKGAEINAQNDYGETPLHVATFRDNQDVAGLLLDEGAKFVVARPTAEASTRLHFDAVSKNGFTPVEWALSHGKKGMVALLLGRSAGRTAAVVRAGDLWESGKRDEAMLLYRAVHAMAPADSWTLGVVGWAFHRNGENQEALPLLERAAQLDPTESPRYSLAAVLFADQQHAKAAEHARWLVEQEPLDSGYLSLLGTTASRTDSYREQVQVQQTLLRIDPQRADVVLYSQLAVGQAALGDCAAARDTLVSGLRAFPNADTLPDWLVITTYCMAGHAAAAAVWQERNALRSSSDRAAFYKLVYYGMYDLGERAERAGAHYAALGHFARAYGATREAADTARVNPDWVSEERAHLRSRLFELYRALPLKPAIPPEAHALMQQGERSLMDGDRQTASTQYEAAVEIAPWSPEARYNLGLTFGAAFLNDLPRAIREMEFVLTLSPPASPLARSATEHLSVWRERQRKALEVCGGHVQPNGSGSPDTPQLILREDC